MNRGAAHGVFVIAVLFVSFALFAQNSPSNPRKFAKTVMRVAKGAVQEVEGQNTVVPGCPGSGEELREPTMLEVDPGTHHLNTVFDVVQEPRQVPVYLNNNNVWTCSMQTFNLRMYKDPKDGVAKYPGPTLHLRRESENYKPGDSWSIKLINHLPPSDEECSWAGADGKGSGQCDCSDPNNLPQCCGDTQTPVRMNCMHGDNTTNLHFHGTHVSPQAPQDYVLLQLTPCGTPPGSVMHGKEYEVPCEYQYAVNPLPANQAEGTHWWHPHKHGSTADQVGNGMAGALIIEGPFDDWLNDYYKQKNRYLRNKILSIQNVHDLNFTSKTGGINPIALVNGQLVPQVTMYKGEIQRWRFVNENIDADSQLVIDFDGVDTSSAVDPQARQIAMDGVQFSKKNYDCQPMLDPTPCDGHIDDLKFMFSPGNRADFLIKAPNAVGEFFVPYEVFGAIDEQGEKPGKGSHARQVQISKLRAALDAVAPGSSQPALLSINVIDCPLKDGCDMQYPTVDEYPDLPPFLHPIVPNRSPQYVQFQILTDKGVAQVPPNPAPDGKFAIWVKGMNNDQPMQFDDRCAAFTEVLDPQGGEEWHISQNGKRGGKPPLKPFHVFHIHINPFQVVSTYDLDGKKVVYPEPIWQDSITLPNNTNPNDVNNPSTEVVIRQRFEDYTGPYVLHCHFLGHEDRGMMLTVQTVCPDGTWSEASPDGSPDCRATRPLKPLPPCPVADTANAHSH